MGILNSQFDSKSGSEHGPGLAVSQRFPHRDDIRRWNVCLDIVDRVENETAARRERVDISSHIILDLLRRPSWQYSLRIHSPAPKGDVLAKIAF